MSNFLESWWSGKSSKKEEEVDVEQGREEEVDVEQGREEEGGGKEAEGWTMGLEGLVRSVSDYASTLGETVKNSVQDSPMKFVNEFQEEQERFARDQRRQKDAAVPPWVGYNEEDAMKAQILELSADSRNVLRNPPPGVQFNFNFVKSSPVAMAVLKEDPRLQRLRFDLVPKKVLEETFWRNYFYRVFLIKQSSQLSTLSSEEQAASSYALPEDAKRKEDETDKGEREGEEEGGEREGPLAGGFTAEQEPQGAQAEEFASDALGPVELSRDSLREELGQLGVSASPSKGKEEARWEAELQAELRELELQGLELGLEGEGEGPGLGEGGAEEEEEAWEAELQQMLDSHSEQKQD